MQTKTSDKKITKRIGVLISGNGSNLQALLDAQEAGKLHGEVVFVLSNKSDAYGLKRAMQKGIATSVIDNKAYNSRSEFDAKLAKELDKRHLDLVVLAGFMRILTPEFVAHFQGKLINIHPSLLPLYKGLDTHKRALADKAKFHGCSLHFVTAELDSGALIARAILRIAENETEASLQQRVHKLEHFLYPKVVSWIMQDRLVYKNNQAFLDEKPIGARGIEFDFKNEKPNQ